MNLILYSFFKNNFHYFGVITVIYLIFAGKKLCCKFKKYYFTNKYRTSHKFNFSFEIIRINEIKKTVSLKSEAIENVTCSCFSLLFQASLVL